MSEVETKKAVLSVSTGRVDFEQIEECARAQAKDGYTLVYHCYSPNGRTVNLLFQRPKELATAISVEGCIGEITDPCGRRYELPSDMGEDAVARCGAVCVSGKWYAQDGGPPICDCHRETPVYKITEENVLKVIGDLGKINGWVGWGQIKPKFGCDPFALSKSSLTTKSQALWNMIINLVGKGVLQQEFRRTPMKTCHYRVFRLALLPNAKVTFHRHQPSPRGGYWSPAFGLAGSQELAGRPISEVPSYWVQMATSASFVSDYGATFIGYLAIDRNNLHVWYE